MPITEADVTQLRGEYPGIAIMARRPRKFRTFMKRLLADRPDDVAVDDVVAVRAIVPGIRGGGNLRPQPYEIVLDVSELTLRLPRAWVTAPEDSAIRHTNIWRSTHEGSFCPWLQMSLPHLCWFTFEQAWMAAPPSGRTLGSALEFAKQLLNTENHDSPAR